MQIKQCDNSILTLQDQEIKILEQYANEIKKWNGLSLVAKSTEDDILGWHILDALSICCVAKNWIQYELVDFGAGSGILGYSLQCLGFSNVSFVERSAIKIDFLKKILKLSKVFESLEQISKPAVLMARGVSSVDNILTKANSQFEKIVLFKAIDIKKELAQARKKWNFTCKFYARKARAYGTILLLEEISLKQPK